MGAAIGGGCAEEDGADVGAAVGGGCAEEDGADVGVVVVGVIGSMEGGTVCRVVVLNKLNIRCWVLAKSIVGSSGGDGSGGCTEEGNHGIRVSHKASKWIQVLSKSIPRD